MKKCSFTESLPPFPLPKQFKTEEDYLSCLTWTGAYFRYGKDRSEVINQRIETELQTIRKYGKSRYFLIVADFVRAARKMDVLVGVGRGYVPCSVVAYCLHITDIDPIKYNLPYEESVLKRIDIDVEEAGREKIVEYLREKYGEERVLPMAVRRFKQEKFVGYSAHLSGVVLGADSLARYGLMVTTMDGELAYSCEYNDNMPYTVFNIIGSHTLTQIKNISHSIGLPIDWSKIPDDDEQTFAVLRNGETDALDLYASDEMKAILRLAKPTTIQDLIKLYPAHNAPKPHAAAYTLMYYRLAYLRVHTIKVE